MYVSVLLQNTDRKVETLIHTSIHLKQYTQSLSLVGCTGKIYRTELTQRLTQLRMSYILQESEDQVLDRMEDIYHSTFKNPKL